MGSPCCLHLFKITSPHTLEGSVFSIFSTIHFLNKASCCFVHLSSIDFNDLIILFEDFSMSFSFFWNQTLNHLGFFHFKELITSCNRNGSLVTKFSQISFTRNVFRRKIFSFIRSDFIELSNTGFSSISPILSCTLHLHTICNIYVHPLQQIMIKIS